MNDAFDQDYKVEIRNVDGPYVTETLTCDESCYTETWRDAEGRKHRELGPAVIARRKDTDEVIGQEWWKHGLRHRDGGPAWLVTSGNDLEEIWYQHGKQSREDGPSRIVKALEITLILTEEWQRAGLSHRVGGPAFIARTADGIAQTEFWQIDGMSHRLDGPAEILRDSETGIAVEESWKVGGELHREGGPAEIYRDSVTGVVTEQRHFRNGVEIPAPTGTAPQPQP